MSINAIAKSAQYIGKMLAKSKVKIPNIKIGKEILPYKQAKKMFDISNVNISDFHIKPDISMPINIKTLNAGAPSKLLEGSLSDITSKSELGNVSLRLAKYYENALVSAQEEVKNIFKGYDLSIRAKGANSIYSKLENLITKKGKVIQTDAQAFDIIQDAIGGRITMHDLTFSDVVNTIKTFKFNGLNLTEKEQNIMLRFFKNKKLNASEKIVADKLSRPIKLALAEKQSDPVFKNVMVSSLKAALDEGATTIEKIEKSGIRKDIIAQLKSTKNIQPLRMTEISNYVGKDGIPYFSEAQINQLKELQAVTTHKFDISSVPEAKRFSGTLTKLEQDAIKDSGYTTAQFNAVLSDGNWLEVQIRGKGPFGEIEHLAYDARKGKNTLGSVYNNYKKAVCELTNEEYSEYQKYISKCYDYYRDAEIGITSTKPILPSKFSGILSQESMIKLHDADLALQAQRKMNFVQHINIAA